MPGARGEAPADRGQGRRHERDGGGHAQEHDGETGDAERRQDRHAEHEQPGHGDGHGERREHDGRPGRGDGGHHGVVHVEAVAALLAEPVDHQQAVVDAETDPEHVDDVDREDRHVAEPSGADEDGEGRDDAAQRDDERHAGGDQSTEQQDHDHDGDGQGDRLAAEQVVLGCAGEGLAHQDVAADEDLWGVEPVREVLDLVGDRFLGVVVEAAGQGDDRQGGTPVGGPQRVGPRRPRVGHVEHAVEGGDRRQAGGEVASGRPGRRRRRRRHDDDLTTGLGEVVQLVGDPTGLGRRAGAELGRQHVERGAADDRGHDEDADPRDDDGAPAAHDEPTEPAHHTAA